MNNSVVALRLDDVGASSKRYEVYSNKHLRLKGVLLFSGDWLFLKYLPPFKAWGPYRELNEDDWMQIFWVLQENSAKLTIAITATWATSEHELVPFPKKFPNEARLLREGVKSGLLEIANHGLTHSQIKDNDFRPKAFYGNRKSHREFGKLVPNEAQEEHIRLSQEILQDYFEVNIVTFVPPGNDFGDNTLEIASRYGIEYISCNSARRLVYGVQILGNDKTVAFHDRDLVMKGTQFFNEIFEENRAKEFVFVKDLHAHLDEK
jgi:hypothetical protein